MQNKKSVVERPLFKIQLNDKRKQNEVKSYATKVADNFQEYLVNKKDFLKGCEIDASLLKDNYILQEYKFFNDRRIIDIKKSNSIYQFISIMIEYNKMPDTFIKLQKIESDGPEVKSPVVVNVVLAGNVVVAVEYAAIAAVAYVLGSPEKETMSLENNIINFNVKSLRYNTQYFKVIQLAQILYGETFAKDVDDFIYQEHLEFPKRMMKHSFSDVCSIGDTVLG